MQIKCVMLYSSPNNLPTRKNDNENQTSLDCSSKSNNSLSLNQCLHQGLMLLPKLIGILLRFRIGKYVVVSDIKKAFTS